MLYISRATRLGIYMQPRISATSLTRNLDASPYAVHVEAHAYVHAASTWSLPAFGYSVTCPSGSFTATIRISHVDLHTLTQPTPFVSHRASWSLRNMYNSHCQPCRPDTCVRVHRHDPHGTRGVRCRMLHTWTAWPRGRCVPGKNGQIGWLVSNQATPICEGLPATLVSFRASHAS